MTYNTTNNTTKPMSKEALKELKKVADKLNIPLHKLLFWTWENILVLKNNADKGNVAKDIKAVENKQITMESKVENNAMRTIINVPDGYVSDDPIHFCFILDTKGTKQAIQPTWNIWKGAKVKIFAYCFGVEYEVFHGDWKMYNLEEDASLEVYEFNYNANNSYMTVYNTFTAKLKDRAFFKNYYVSTVWHLWHGTTKWFVYCNWKESKAEFITKNKILDKDISDLDITFNLNWEKSSWTIASRSVTYSWWTNKFKAKIFWKWDYTKWHIECDEISMWKAVISTMPELLVENPTSRLTHEAAVWTLEKRAIENLLIKWFTEEQAVSFLVNWILDVD